MGWSVGRGGEAGAGRCNKRIRRSVSGKFVFSLLMSLLFEL